MRKTEQVSAHTIARGLAARPQVAALSRSLVRLIHARGIESGGKVPSQAEIRTEFAANNNTLNAAMAVLSSCGVLSRKDRSGTIVDNPNAVIPGLWRVGLVLNIDRGFYSQMLVYLHAALNALGAGTTIYIRDFVKEDKGNTVFADIDGLDEAFDDGCLDGLITQSAICDKWTQRERRHVAIEHVGAWEQAPSGVVIDMAHTLEVGYAHLTSLGCGNIGLVSSTVHESMTPRLFATIADTQRKAEKERLLFSRWTMETNHRNYHEVGREIVAKLLAVVPNKRPDGLIVMNDNMAAVLTAILVNTTYRPKLVVQTNRQIPIVFPMPVSACEVDVEKLASISVRRTLARMCNPTLPMLVEWYKPRLLSNTK